MIDNKTVAIIEDDEENGELISILLKRNGFKVYYYPDCYKFLEDVKKSLEFDVLLLDIQLPLMDGYSLLNHLRDKYANVLKRTKIIALTALAMEEDKQRCLSLGANSYLSKPFRLNKLLSCINRLLKDEIKVDNGTQK